MSTSRGPTPPVSRICCAFGASNRRDVSRDGNFLRHVALVLANSLASRPSHISAPPQSTEDSLDNFTMHVSQAILSALVAVSQPSVVDSTEMQDRGLHVVDVDGIGSDVPREVVG